MVVVVLGCLVECDGGREEERVKQADDERKINIARDLFRACSNYLAISLFLKSLSNSSMP